jgi:1-acyl-sn-glycerol-3-phosphate acyltransferase
MIRTVVVVALTLAYLLLMGMPVVIYAIMSGKRDAVFRVGVWGCRWALWLGGVKVEVYGREKVPTDRAVVFMPNHQSNCDPPAVISAVPPVRVLLKKELFRVPVLGLGMKLAGFIAVDRKNRERAIQAVDEAVEALKAGHSFVIYPEGTRSPDGRLLPFKRGAFVLAIKAQAPIVPMSVSGASRIMRKGESVIHPGTLRITFHAPISTEGYSVEDRGLILKRVRQAVLIGLSEEEQPLESAAAKAELSAMHGIASGGRHQIALQHGFSRVDVNGEIVLYEHPDKGVLHTFSDGSWKHVARDGTETSGAGTDDLSRHLNLQKTKKPN